MSSCVLHRNRNRTGAPRRQTDHIPLLCAAVWLGAFPAVGADETGAQIGRSSVEASPARVSSYLEQSGPASGLDREKLLQVSAQLTRGYYQALFEAQFAQAAGFLHPEFLLQMQKSWLQNVQAAKPAVQKKQLASLGVNSLSEASLLSGVDFFARYAKGPDGAGLRRLSEPGLLQMRAIVEHQTCQPETKSCQVELRIKGSRENGTAISAPQTLWVRYAEGKFWVDSRPPETLRSQAPE